jgi:hypothetical protein
MKDEHVRHLYMGFLSGLLARRRHASSRDMRGTVAALWKRLLVGFPILALLMLAWSVYLFWGISRETIFTGPVEEFGEAPTISREELHAILNFFRTRTARFEALTTSPPETVDPAR